MMKAQDNRVDLLAWSIVLIQNICIQLLNKIVKLIMYLDVGTQGQGLGSSFGLKSKV